MCMYVCYLVQIAGIVYIRPKVSEILVSWHVIPPLDSCTYIALDNGAKPVSVSVLQVHTTATHTHTFVVGGLLGLELGTSLVAVIVRLGLFQSAACCHGIVWWVQ